MQIPVAGDPLSSPRPEERRDDANERRRPVMEIFKNLHRGRFITNLSGLYSLGAFGKNEKIRRKKKTGDGQK